MGWARANIIFDKARKLPTPGSPMEIMFILVWKMKQAIDFQKSRAMIQGLLAQKGADDDIIKQVFDDLKEAFFPFDKNEKKADTQKMREYLMSEVSKGPLSVVPMEDPGRKRMMPKLERGRRELAKRLSLEKSGQLVEMDGIKKAMRRPRGVS